MQGTIQEFGKSKSGNPKVKIDQRWYTIKSLDNMAMGGRIDFDCHEFQYNGMQFWEVDSWGYQPNSGPGAGASAATPRSPPAPTPQQAPPSAAPSASPAPLSEPELRFISNCVGNAIAAKTIEDPIDLIAWVKGARAALESLNDGGF